MAVFEMIKYHSQKYTKDIPIRTEECATHFDITSIKANLRCSFHTEYSYGKRKFDSPLIQRFPALLNSQKNGVPQLWNGSTWASEFAQFLCTLAKDEPPEVIEIHPPFSDYASFDSFLESYKEFETLMIEKYPDINILIENRFGSVYKGGKFLVSRLHEIENLCELIVQHNLRLKIACDIPQIYTAHNVKEAEQYISLLKQIEPFRKQIGGVHLWGKKKSNKGRLISHCGDLLSYFEGDLKLKDAFLNGFNACFDDGLVRKMVLEVNSGNNDLMSIISDIRNHNIVFK